MVATSFLGLVLAFAAWAFGGVNDGSLAAISAAVGAAVVLRLTGAATARWSLPPSAVWRWSWGAPLLALALLIAVQAINSSHVYSPLQQGLVPHPHLPGLPAGVDGRTAAQSLLKLLTYAGMFWLACGLAEGRQRRGLMAIATGSGFVMAMLVVLQRVTPRPFPVFPLTGMFVNANNYAAYANLLIPVALGLAARAGREARSRGALSHPGYLLRTLAGGLVLSVFMTGSRAGTLIAAGQVAVWVALEGRAAGAPDRVRRWLMALTVLALLAVLFAFARTVPGVHDGSGVASLKNEIADRLAVDRATLCLFAERWLFGSGAGTFALAFPYYQPVHLAGFYRYAHNDPLQYLAELGVVGFGLLAALGLGAWYTGRQARPPPGRAVRGGPDERQGAAVALGGLALHALVDFPLHIPAIALLAAAWVGLLQHRSRHALSGGGETPPSKPQNGRSC